MNLYPESEDAPEPEQTNRSIRRIPRVGGGCRGPPVSASLHWPLACWGSEARVVGCVLGGNNTTITGSQCIGTSENLELERVRGVCRGGGTFCWALNPACTALAMGNLLRPAKHEPMSIAKHSGKNGPTGSSLPAMPLFCAENGPSGQFRHLPHSVSLKNGQFRPFFSAGANPTSASWSLVGGRQV